MMERVLIIEPVLAHYRRDFYKHLLSNEEFHFNIIAGKDYQNILELEDKNFKVFPYITMALFGHKFYYLRGCLRYVRSSNPRIIMCSGVDFHHIHTIVMFVWFRLIRHHSFYWWTHGSVGKQGRMGVFIRKLMYRKASGALVYSLLGRDRLMDFGVKERNIQVISNAVNWDDYGYLNRNLAGSNRKDNKFRLLFSGRISKAKKLDLLMQALGIISHNSQLSFICNIIGPGDTTGLSMLSEEIGISDRVFLHGPLYGRDVHDLFADSDILVYPGAIGLAVLHSFSFGLPVVTTDNMKIQMPEVELIVPGKTGDFFMDDSPDNLADILLQWQVKTSNNRIEIRKNCIKRIDEMGYLPDRVADSVVSFFSKRYHSV